MPTRVNFRGARVTILLLAVVEMLRSAASRDPCIPQTIIGCGGDDTHMGVDLLDQKFE